jgi:hypothetical protein
MKPWETMTRKEAIETLTLHNKWRRSDENIEMVAPKLIGKCIDFAVRDMEAIEGGIKAKALRKKGTGEWYYQWEGAWVHGGIPEELGASLDAATLPPRLYPPDAELVDVVILIKEKEA